LAKLDDPGSLVCRDDFLGQKVIDGGSLVAIKLDDDATTRLQRSIHLGIPATVRMLEKWADLGLALYPFNEVRRKALLEQSLGDRDGHFIWRFMDQTEWDESEVIGRHHWSD